MKYRYYRVKQKRTAYRGSRFFRVNPDEDHVLQICIYPGKVKKGRAHTYGIYLISRLTFLANYKAMDYVEKIPKSEFRKQFKYIVDLMNP